MQQKIQQTHPSHDPSYRTSSVELVIKTMPSGPKTEQRRQPSNLESVKRLSHNTGIGERWGSVRHLIRYREPMRDDGVLGSFPIPWNRNGCRKSGEETVAKDGAKVSSAERSHMHIIS